MSDHRTHAPLAREPLTADRLQNLWRELNERYFRGGLPPIEIIWSRRLTSSAGMFISHVGPRTCDLHNPAGRRRLIRLSVPLLQHHSEGSERELVNTLAHEMIHQWQFDVLKRRPNHGGDFRRKMAVMNRDGLGITICYTDAAAAHALAKYAWRCLRCGRLFHRQRRTIKPAYHRCGGCRGMLREQLPEKSL